MAIINSLAIFQFYLVRLIDKQFSLAIIDPPYFQFYLVRLIATAAESKPCVNVLSILPSTINRLDK